jgi:hypothetical protein
MSNRIYSVKLDKDFDTKIKEFTDGLGDKEKIVSTSVTDDKLIITTEVVQTDKPKNLLLEELKRRE